MRIARERMLAEQLMPHGIHDQAVLEAMLEVPREEFLPGPLRRLAYLDRALGIGAGQTISQPVVVAAMTQALELGAEDEALEVGAGSGYQAAVLSRLCRRVVTLEIEPVLAARAAATLERLGYKNVLVIQADGSRGWPPAAPYQAILVACAAPRLPAPLAEQLDEGGRLVAPLGAIEDEHQELTLVRKREGRLSSQLLFPVRFVPMR